MVNPLSIKPLAALFVALMLAAPVSATTQAEINATLRADVSIWDGLFAIALADQLRETCPTLEARRIRATRFIYGIYGQARDYGFSRSEIRAFQRDDGVGDQMRARVMGYFEENGVREGAPETYCALGEAEIAAGSPAGTLLRAR